jgi:hypothetical protein
MRMLKDLQTEADTEEDAERRFRLTLAYYPLDQSDNK